MRYVLDSKYLEIRNLKENDNVVIFNEKNDKIITLSNDEMEIISKYGEVNDVRKCFLFFKEKYELDNDEIIFEIISRAKKMDILVLDEVEDESYNNYLSFKFNSLLLWLSPLFTIKFRAIKKNKIIQLFSLTINEKRFFPIAFSVLTISILLLYVFNSMAIASETPFFTYFVLLIPFVLFSTLAHELGHLIVYKLCKGEGGKMGGGFLFYVYPIMYCFDMLIIYHKKWQKIAITFGGIVVDLFLMVGMIYLNFDVFFLLLIMYRTLLNLNPLVGKTDGFYIIKDVFGFEPMYFIKRGAWLFIQHLRKFNFKWNYFVDFLIFAIVLLLNVAFYGSIIFMYYWF